MSHWSNHTRPLAVLARNTANQLAKASTQIIRAGPGSYGVVCNNMPTLILTWHCLDGNNNTSIFKFHQQSGIIQEPSNRPA